ncbi:hypothetical protein FJZ40_01960 [Candidatus Shapirobacteria bacterium]|nr:hypothetical protein [Candidatus Shapirobacteria bacterium]
MPYACRQKRLEYARRWNKDYYEKNKEIEKQRIAKRKGLIGKWIAGYKEGLSCQRCEEKTTVCLDFHHKDGQAKDFTLGRAKSWGWSINRIKREIEKCIVLCANCHRKEHALNNAG